MFGPVQKYWINLHNNNHQLPGWIKTRKNFKKSKHFWKLSATLPVLMSTSCFNIRLLTSFWLLLALMSDRWRPLGHFLWMPSYTVEYWGGSSTVNRNFEKWTRASETGHPVRLGACGLYGSTPSHKCCHAGFWRFDFGDVTASWFVSLTVLDAGTAAKVQIKICICGNNPWGRAPFFQGVWSLDTAFDFLSWSTQTAVLWEGEKE